MAWEQSLLCRLQKRPLVDMIYYFYYVGSNINQ